MRRLVGWIGGAVGGITAYRLLRRRREAAPEPSSQSVPAEPDERAEELRTKLAESRAAESVVEEPPAEPEPAEEETDSPEERRRRVHEQGRAALDEMSSE